MFYDGLSKTGVPVKSWQTKLFVRRGLRVGCSLLPGELSSDHNI